MRYPPDVRAAFRQRLGRSWRDLADRLDIPGHESRRFPAGEEPWAIWQWLEEQDGFHALPAALQDIGRQDLVDLLTTGTGNAGPVGPGSGPAPSTATAGAPADPVRTADQAATAPGSSTDAAATAPRPVGAPVDPPAGAGRPAGGPALRADRRWLLAGVLAAVVAGGGFLAAVQGFGGPPPAVRGGTAGPTPPPALATPTGAQRVAPPDWLPARPVSDGRPPHGVRVSAPVPGARIPGRCLTVSGTVRDLPSGKTIVVATRSTDGSPDMVLFFYFPARDWQDLPSAGVWQARAVMGTAVSQEYQVAVLVADAAPVRAALDRADGSPLNSRKDDLGAVHVAAFFTVVQTRVEGDC